MGVQPGQFVTPQVRLVQLLGKGGMGSVWVADHLALEIQVAVKFMSPALAENEMALARFRREATSAAKLKSPHVVQIFNHGVMEGGIPFIVMELLEGEDLGHRIERLGQLPVDEIDKILAQVTKALSKAHGMGIVHRDIKPDNIFLVAGEDDIFVKVLDFGVAKQAVSTGVAMTSSGALLGTPLYMSPEQLISAKQADHTADLWSLAAVVYEAITGVVPFQANAIGELCLAVSEGNFALPSTRRPGCPPGVDAWMQRALNPNGAARFGSAKLLAEAFHAAVTGQAIVPAARLEYASTAPAVDDGAEPSSMDAQYGQKPPTFGGTAATAPGVGGAPTYVKGLVVAGVVGTLLLVTGLLVPRLLYSDDAATTDGGSGGAMGAALADEPSAEESTPDPTETAASEPDEPEPTASASAEANATARQPQRPDAGAPVAKARPPTPPPQPKTAPKPPAPKPPQPKPPPPSDPDDSFHGF